NPALSFGAAAVCAVAVAAGIIASSSGRPIATPAPRSTVRRDKCFFVRNTAALLRLPAVSLRALGHARCRDALRFVRMRHGLHAERLASDDTFDDRREAIVL